MKFSHWETKDCCCTSVTEDSRHVITSGINDPISQLQATEPGRQNFLVNTCPLSFSPGLRSIHRTSGDEQAALLLSEPVRSAQYLPSLCPYTNHLAPPAIYRQHSPAHRRKRYLDFPCMVHDNEPKQDNRGEANKAFQSERIQRLLQEKRHRRP